MLCFAVAASWSEWSDWSECSKSCEGGARERNRTCLDTVTRVNITDTECGTEKGEESEGCNTDPCPVNGELFALSTKQA